MKPFSLQTPATRGLKKEDFSFYPDILLSRLLSKWTIDDSSTRDVHFLSEMKLSLLSRLSYGAKIIFQISIFVFFLWKSHPENGTNAHAWNKNYN